GSSGALNGMTMGDISDPLKNLFTPASYAFSIWGFIYLLLLGFVIYQSRSLFTKVRDDGFIIKTGWWFVLSCVANMSWIVLWLYGYIGFSVIAIFFLLFSLLKIVMKNQMEMWDTHTSVITLLWWPFVFYSGWGNVDSITYVTTCHTSSGRY